MNRRVGNQSAFTIVELLIVIVVIAVLATIAVVSYNGIQTRASNAAVISAAKQTIKLVKAYQATYDKYPISGGAYCLTIDNQCTNYSGTVVSTDNTALLTELQKIGRPADSVARAASNRYGIYWDYYAPRTYNHKSVPLLIMYNLVGQNQKCGLDDVATGDPAPLAGETNAFITSTTGYTGNDSGTTRCWISIDL